MSRQSKGIVFRRIEGSRLKITKEALDTFKAFIQDNPDKKEAGGVLLGRMIKDSEDIIIDLISQPQESDKQERTFFRRNDEHQIIINEEWIKSGGTCNYLGEWHTHPEANPTPSGIDLKNWKQQLIKAKYEGYTLFFVIVGIIKIAVYEGNRTTLKIKKLVKYEQNKNNQ